MADGVKTVETYRFEIPRASGLLRERTDTKSILEVRGFEQSVFVPVFHAVTRAEDRHGIGMMQESIEHC